MSEPRSDAHLIHPTRSRGGPHRIAIIAVIAVLLMRWSAVDAIATGSMDLGIVQGEGWVASGVTLELDLRAKPIQAHARVERFTITALGAQAEHVLRDLRLDCAKVRLNELQIECADARIAGHFPSLGTQQLHGRLLYNRATQRLNFLLSDIRVANGQAQISGDWQAGAWSMQAKLTQVHVDKLIVWLKQWVATLPKINAQGQVDIDISTRGHDALITQLNWQLQTREFTVNNSAGTIATDKLRLSSKGALVRIGNNQTATWRFDGALQADGGQAYAEPVFLSFQKNPLHLTVQGEWRRDGAILVNDFAIQHTGALLAHGNAQLTYKDTVHIPQLHIDIQQAQLPGAYTQYLQPFLIGTAMGTLNTLGTATGAMDVAEDAPVKLSLALHDINATDTQKRWSVDTLSGTLNWRKNVGISGQNTSRLQWQRAQVLGLDVGAATLEFTAADRDFVVTQAAHIPFLDSNVELAGLQVKQAGLPTMSMQLDATLAPVSVQRLCKAFGWPEFGGRLGGHLSSLQLRDGVVTLGTTLRASVFDGSVSITDLRLEQSLSKWPRLSASVAIDSVDLEQVTTAFSFGRITGRLSGAINDLHLFNWQPVSFDAKLYTPADDRSRHRISQRAVQSIGKLGGSDAGISGALSSGLLRFFDDFNYERLGISCQLANDVCTMNGVAPASTGYYLVKGRGLPRIDVVGNSQRVAWSRLVAQLKAATQSQGPVVK